LKARSKLEPSSCPSFFGQKLDYIRQQRFVIDAVDIIVLGKGKLAALVIIDDFWRAMHPNRLFYGS